MRYLALDQALNTTGWAVFEDNKLLETGTFQTKSSSPIEQRLGMIWSNLDTLLEAYNFEYLFFEDIQQQRGNVETYKKLAYTQAAILLWCYWKGNVPYSILAPSHWRKIIKENYKVTFGRARAEQKKAAQQFVEQQFSIKVSEDMSDAVCIGLAGIAEYNKNRSAF